MPESAIDTLCTGYRNDCGMVHDAPYEAISLAASAIASHLAEHLTAFTERAVATSDADMYAADKPASLPLVQLFLALLQLSALQPDSLPDNRIRVCSHH